MTIKTQNNIVTFEDRREAKHALNCKNVNHIEMEESTVRLSFMNEILKFDMVDEKAANKLFTTITEQMMA